MEDVTDLLQPSLTPADDGVGFDRPWDPGWLGWLVVLAGPFGAGWLMWRNQRRLGLRGGLGMWAAMAVCGVVVLVLVTLVAPWIHGGPMPEDGARLLRYASNLVAVPFGFWLLRDQKRRFFIAETLGVVPARLLGPGLLAWLLNLLVVVGLAGVVVALRNRG